VALITGSSRGIGAGVALEYAKAGYDLALHYVHSQEQALAVKARAEAEGARAALVRGDISVLGEIDRVFEEVFALYDQVDVLVNNAGITRFAPFLETTPDLFDALVSTDFKGAFFCAQQAARHMVAKKTGGGILNITSNHQAGCWPQASVYASVKAAVQKFTQNAALELAPYGIRVVALAPGYTRTRQLSPEEEAAQAPLYKKLPLHRLCEPWEIGRACVFLSGEGAGYITGACLTMDGGALLPAAPENIYTNIHSM
jgi:NAD(P)-dependent dehydrogenase (short-subunit alcohol dehydrogenase family)